MQVLQPKPTKLDAFQMQPFLAILTHYGDSNREVVLTGAPGCGKTLIINATAGHLLRQGKIDAALILCPQTDIRENFIRKGLIEFPFYGNALLPDLDLQNAYRPYPKDGSWTRCIKNHLIDPRGGLNQGILVATHSAAGLLLRENPDLLDKIEWPRVLVAMDETHHACADWDRKHAASKKTDMGGFALEAMDRGAYVLKASASLDRTKPNEKVYSDKARIVSISYQDIVEQRGAPEHRVLKLISPSDENGLKDFQVKTENQFLGETKNTRWGGGAGVLTKEDALNLANVAAEESIDGKIKAFIRFLRITGTRNVEYITEALEEVWESRGWEKPRIVDGTGPDPSEYFTKLKEEREVNSFADSKVDFFIVCGRGCEGTDWPMCSHYLHVGLINGVPSYIQVPGRTIRKKPEDHPFRNEAITIMFLPSLAPGLIEEMSKRTHKQAAFAACYLHSAQTAQQFIDLFEHQIHLGVQSPYEPKSRGVSRDLVRLQSELSQIMPTPHEIAEATQILGKNERKYAKAAGEPMSVYQNTRMLLNNPTASDRIKVAGLILCLDELIKADVPKQEKDLVHEVVNTFVKGVKRAVTRKDKSQCLLDAFQKVLDQFSHCTVVSKRFEGQVEILSKFSGQDGSDITEQLEKLLFQEVTYDQVLRAYKNWKIAHEFSRKSIHGELSGYFDPPLEGSYTANRLKRDLKQGLPGQPPDVTSLSDLRELRSA